MLGTTLRFFPLGASRARVAPIMIYNYVVHCLEQMTTWIFHMTDKYSIEKGDLIFVICIMRQA